MIEMLQLAEPERLISLDIYCYLVISLETPRRIFKQLSPLLVTQSTALDVQTRLSALPCLLFLKDASKVARMQNTSNDDRLAGLDPEEWDEIDVGTRIDLNGKTTYHVLTSDRKVGYFVEKVYNEQQNLVRIVKRGKNSRSETDFSPDNGDVVRIFEACTLPDGNSMTKEIVYFEDRSTETVIVISPDGELIRTVQRESVGIRTLSQGQTDYKRSCVPSVTINHTMDPKTGKLVQREQVRWLRDGQRALTELFYFGSSGVVYKYTKILYHASGGPFLEETHRYGPESNLLRREIIQYNPTGVQTAADLTMYDDDGEIVQRSTTYYDHRGSAVSTDATDNSALESWLEDGDRMLKRLEEAAGE